MASDARDYVHGYSEREAQRLSDQAAVLRSLIHDGIRYPPGSLVLEAGCGTGRQTVTLCERNPGCTIIAVDLSASSLTTARASAAVLRSGTVAFVRADLRAPPFPAETFDHIFVCFVLEHLRHPLETLRILRSCLKPGGSLTAVEGDHGSCYFHPETPAARAVWACLPDVQKRQGGDGLIGRRLYPLLAAAGFRNLSVTPRVVYADETRPAEVAGFVHKTIVPMVEGVRAEALAHGLVDEATWERGIADLRATGAGPEGTFCYTFFRGVGVR